MLKEFSALLLHGAQSLEGLLNAAREDLDKAAVHLLEAGAREAGGRSVRVSGRGVFAIESPKAELGGGRGGRER